MARKRKKLTASGVIAAVLGCICAVMLAVLFYGAMVYQLAGEDTAASQEEQGASGLLALNAGTLMDETTVQQEVGGALCTVVTRTYQLEDGTQAKAVTAAPSAYLERFAGEDVSMQLITGFVIDGLDAVYARSGEGGLLIARQGDTVYVVEGPQDQQTLYELGALARRDAEQ